MERLGERPVRAVRTHTHTHTHTLHLTCQVCLLLPRVQPRPDMYYSLINKWVYLFLPTPPGTGTGKQRLGSTAPSWSWRGGVQIPPGAISFIKLHAEPLNSCRSSNAVVLTRYWVTWPYTRLPAVLARYHAPPWPNSEISDKRQILLQNSNLHQTLLHSVQLRSVPSVHGLG